MFKKIKRLIRKVSPRAIKVMHEKYRQRQIKNNSIRFQSQLIKYLRNSSEFEKSEKEEILDYLANNPPAVFPYNFSKKYNANDIIVYTDHDNGMKYVLHENKRLYFKKKWNEEEIRICYNALLMEQDIDSPHRYQTPVFCVNDGDVVVDVGCAEGNFALSIVDKVEKLYLFEVDKDWIDALKMTFAPWKEKVEIVCKYVSDSNKIDCTTLDTFFEKKKIDVIKADIEGAEISLLKGSHNILSSNEKLKIMMCTYHRQNDAEDINQLLTKCKFHTEFSKGYMFFFYDDYLAPPYLRKGLIRAMK